MIQICGSLQDDATFSRFPMTPVRVGEGYSNPKLILRGEIQGEGESKLDLFSIMVHERFTYVFLGVWDDGFFGEPED